MNRTLKNLWVPLGSFALAMLLATFAGPSSRALARKFADPTVNGDVCESDVKNLRGRVKTRHLRVDGTFPGLSLGSVRAHSLVDYRGGAVRNGVDVRSQNDVFWTLELVIMASVSIGNGDPVNQEFILNIPTLDSSNVESFFHTGIERKKNIEGDFHEEGRDLGRLLHRQFRQMAEQGVDADYNPETEDFDFDFTIGSLCYAPPPVNMDDKPCKKDNIYLSVKVAVERGSGFNRGVKAD